jgi:hypothetical protein
MAFYIQHGYGKGQKLRELVDLCEVEGVILSPADEDTSNLADTARWLNESGLRPLIDPQTYLYTTQPAGRGRNHGSHNIEFDGLSWAQGAQSVSKHIRSVGTLNRSINPNGLWISPGPMQDSFTDVWTPLSVQFARTASEEWGADRTLATIAVEESGLADWLSIERWLDVATTMPVAGFYILVSRASTTYPAAPWPPARLANLLRLVHVLANVNGFQVIWGYADLEGVLASAVGASGTASGWSYTLRQFSSSKWLNPATGGRPATVRVPMSRLWSLPRAEAEAATMFNSELREALFDPSEVTSYGARTFESIGRVEAQISHLVNLSKQDETLRRLTTQAQRLDAVQSSLKHALRLWTAVDQSALLADPGYSSRVESLLRALELFRSQAKR